MKMIVIIIIAWCWIDGFVSTAAPAWRNWDNSQLERWLTDHKVPNPGVLVLHSPPPPPFFVPSLVLHFVIPLSLCNAVTTCCHPFFHGDDDREDADELKTRLYTYSSLKAKFTIRIIDWHAFLGRLSTEQLRDLVQSNYDKAYDTWWVGTWQGWKGSFWYFIVELTW